MAGLNPYLNYPGTTEEAFNFYKSVFGGDFANLMRFKDTPEASKLSAEEGEKIMHVSYPIKGTMLMATDALESMGQKIDNGNSFHLAVSADSKEEADKYFNSLAVGGTVVMPLMDTFWGAYFGMLKDKYGVQWMVSHDKNMQQ